MEDSPGMIPQEGICECLYHISPHACKGERVLARLRKSNLARGAVFWYTIIATPDFDICQRVCPRTHCTY